MPPTVRIENRHRCADQQSQPVRNTQDTVGDHGHRRELRRNRREQEDNRIDHGEQPRELAEFQFEVVADRDQVQPAQFGRNPQTGEDELQVPSRSDERRRDADFVHPRGHPHRGPATDHRRGRGGQHDDPRNIAPGRECNRPSYAPFAHCASRSTATPRDRPITRRIRKCGLRSLLRTLLSGLCPSASFAVPTVRGRSRPLASTYHIRRHAPLRGGVRTAGPRGRRRVIS